MTIGGKGAWFWGGFKVLGGVEQFIDSEREWMEGRLAFFERRVLLDRRGERNLLVVILLPLPGNHCPFRLLLLLPNSLVLHPISTTTVPQEEVDIKVFGVDPFQRMDQETNLFRGYGEAKMGMLLMADMETTRGSSKNSMEGNSNRFLGQTKAKAKKRQARRNCHERRRRGGVLEN